MSSNNSNTQETTFWKFLTDFTIEIPIIQRDYAQGRFGKEYLRKSFLTDLKNALDSQNKMILDFVYGSVENGKLSPLDGQQRLTTLWLLHWYIALRAGELNEDNCVIFRHFSYETRISSREFCQNLCVPEHFKTFDGSNIVNFITNQTWFYSAWKQDPTIESMLNMLGGTKIADKKGEDIIDGLEELLTCPLNCGGNKCVFIKSFEDYWNLLTNDTCPIVFYHLPLHDFGLSDDLYIKMNARGKQLTSFENFKADLIGYISKHAEEETSETNEYGSWKPLLDTQAGIPIKLDTDWTDIFWKNKSKGIKNQEGKSVKSNQIDEIFFAFLNRFFWNELFIATKNDGSYLLDIGKGDEDSAQENQNDSYKYLNDSENPNDYDTKIAYHGLDVYKYDNGIPIKFFQKLQKVLNNYYKYTKDNKTLPECHWDSNFRFIPVYEEDKDGNIEIINNANEDILKVSTLNQVQRIVFFALCKYFDHDEKVKDDEDSLKRWLRVVWNLVSGEDEFGRPQIRSTSAIRIAIEFIDKLESHSVYESLKTKEINENNPSAFQFRCKEEIKKAKKILSDDGCLLQYKGQCVKQDGKKYETWEEIIIQAEKYAFFKGAIRFLFTDEKGEVNWDNFDTRWNNAQKYFDNKGVNKEYRKNAQLLRTLLSRIEISEQWFGNYKGFWLDVLCDVNNSSAINEILTNESLKINDSCKEEWINNESFLSALLEEEDSGWHIFNEWGGHKVLTRYSQRRKYATSYKQIVVFNVLRNDLLSDENITIGSDYKVHQGLKYLYGWNINFKYKESYFQWYGKQNDKELDVYLMEEEWKSYKKRKKETTDKGTDEDNYFCFSVTKEMEQNANLFTKQLDCLIIQAYLDADKSVCEECKEKDCAQNLEK